MSQSGWIAAALLGGFIVYLAIKGRLGTYYGFLVGGSTAGSVSSSAPPSSGTGSTAAPGGAT